MIIAVVVSRPGPPAGPDGSGCSRRSPGPGWTSAWDVHGRDEAGRTGEALNTALDPLTAALRDIVTTLASSSENLPGVAGRMNVSASCSAGRAHAVSTTPERARLASS